MYIFGISYMSFDKCMESLTTDLIRVNTSSDTPEKLCCLLVVQPFPKSLATTALFSIINSFAFSRMI